MYVTQRFENLDASQKRHATLPPTLRWLSKSFYTLRLGLTLQLLSIAIIFGGYLGAGGGLFSYTLIGADDAVCKTRIFKISASVGSFLYVLGTFYITLFQIFMSDDASWSRGFRSGSKFLGYATVLDMLAGVIQFVLLLHLAFHYSPHLLAQFNQGGPAWLITAFAHLLQAIARFFYAPGFFLIEIYHDEGTSALLGFGILVLYSTSGIAEIISLRYQAPSIAPCLIFVTIVCALVWASAFEAELNSTSPQLHESELTNEIEAKVEEFAHLGPPSSSF